MLRIGVDGYALSGHRAGVGNYCASLLREVARRRTDIALRLLQYRVRSGPADPLADFDDEAVEIVGRPRAVTRSSELLHRLGMPVRYDLMLPGSDVYFFTRYWRPRTGSRPALTMVYDLSCFSSPPTAEPRVVHELARDVRGTMRSSEAIGIISEAVGREILERFPEAGGRLVLLPPGARELDADDRRSSTVEVPAPFFLHIGTLEPRKNLRVLINAVRILSLRKSVPSSVPLVLVGRRGWMDDEILQAIVEAGPLVRWVGDVSDSSLRNLYDRATATVVSSRYEGFGLPVLEAMAAGSPVICSDIPVFREVGGSAVAYADTSSAELLADALVDFLRLDAGVIRNRVKLGYRQAARFSLTQTVERFASATYDLARNGSLSTEVQWWPS